MQPARSNQVHATLLLFCCAHLSSFPSRRSCLRSFIPAIPVRTEHLPLPASAAHMSTSPRGQTMSESSIQSASPNSILRYWFGECFVSDSEVERGFTNTKEYYASRKKLWYGGGEALDAEIRHRFATTIREVAAEVDNTHHNTTFEDIAQQEWRTPQGSLAKVVLFDQLSRNAFRGTAEAFAYDGKALAIARAVLEAGGDAALLPIGVITLAKPLMHSEDAADHEALGNVIEQLRSRGPQCFALEGFATSEAQHFAVIRRFGRYPHRNAPLGRTSTREETEWLASKQRPGWAK